MRDRWYTVKVYYPDWHPGAGMHDYAHSGSDEHEARLAYQREWFAGSIQPTYPRGSRVELIIVEPNPVALSAVRERVLDATIVQ